MEPKLPDWLIEGIEKCNVSTLSPMLGRMYSIEHRVYSHVPSITNHKEVRRQITKHGRRNHHFTFADSASPSSSSRNHLTALVLLVVVLVKDFLDANKVVVSACRRHLWTTYRGLPQWCSPSNALRQTTTFDLSSTSLQWGRKSNSYYLQFFVHNASIKITICRRPLTLIEAKLMGFASYSLRPEILVGEMHKSECI